MLSPLEFVESRLKENPFISLIGMEMTNDNEEIKLNLDVSEKLLNGNRTVHGGVYATILDSIMGMEIRYVSGASTATINLNVHFLEAATEGKMIATAKVLKEGYRTITAEAELQDGSGKLLAKASGTFKAIRGK